MEDNVTLFRLFGGTRKYVKGKKEWNSLCGRIHLKRQLVYLIAKNMKLLIFVAVLIMFFCFLHRLLVNDRTSNHIYNIVIVDDVTRYSFVAVTDLDKESRSGNNWISHLRFGDLEIRSGSKNAKINWSSNSLKITSNMAAGSRGMELSDLVHFNHKLLTIDDRTGIVYEIIKDQVVPFVLLVDGPGNVSKPLKGEWMTVKDGYLYVGGLGKEWTTSDGIFVNDHPMWVKIIDKFGRIQHQNWTNHYVKVREAVGVVPPGYMIHEAVQWSNVHNKWFFLPRRMSKTRYMEDDDEKRGTNMLISIDEEFSGPAEITRVNVKDLVGYRGFSAFQFVPLSDDKLIMAIRSEEREGAPLGSYMSLFDMDGDVYLDDDKFQEPYKFEGLAFL